MRGSTLKVLACLASSGVAIVVKDPAMCVSYTPPGSGASGAGMWAVVDGATQQSCLAKENQQWILGWGQSLYPDHHPVPKTWWTKRMSDTGGADLDHHDRLYFAGRPSVRDMKQLYEAGWDAVLSLEDVPEGGEKLGIQPLPTTDEARKVAAEAGLLFHSLPAGLDLTSSAGVDEVANFLDFALANTGSKVNGPVLVFCGTGKSAAAALQLYRARRGLIPKKNSKSVAEQATKEANQHGITFPAKTIEAIAREAGEEPVGGASFPGMRVLPESVEDSLSNYHWLKYLYHIGQVGIFDAGQIQVHHVEALKKANIKAIINMRQGAFDADGNVIGSTQEPVNLLNLEFGVPTKAIGQDATEFLADPARKAMVIDENRPASWVCSYDDETISPIIYSACKEQTNGLNFEVENALEWGDKVGQNPFTEAEDFRKAGIAYYHLPVGAMQQPKPKPFNAATFAEYAPQFIEAVNTARMLGGHVLFHCTIGYRTGAFPTALLAILNQTGVHVANDMMHSWGYDVVDEQTGHVFEQGTNTLFNALHTLEFDGKVDWNKGGIEGAINLASANGDQPQPSTNGGSTTTSDANKENEHEDDESSEDGLLVAILVFSILAFVAASVAAWILYQRQQQDNNAKYTAARSDEEMSQMSHNNNHTTTV